ncbi:Maf family protein [Limnobacter parvus]|uniref:7-methyl-GTP pyrophosphatase n=1 Tax=Limnobacter parvus TaxID=2939690 RepID=A0ABT1XHZ8_9BURK|nr:Maf family nucleotide pyrophosphatase [Limnobacter parvus]MCR2746902.1 Maf family nucleotide pyrophosphatase [Limnobacter parvus]
MTRSLYLASSSKYRRELLARLQINFRCQSPQIDESTKPNETPLDTCQRLAREKALAIAAEHPASVVIGSDQVADVDGVAISKPGTHDRARAQLRSMSGKTIVFHTAVCVCCIETKQTIEFTVPTSVEFRELNSAEIERYLIAEEPYDCAGSAKSEGLGISLLKRIESSDPTALIGLPLIEVANALRQFEVTLP